MALQNPQSADHIAGSAGAFEPQRQNNFTVEIPLGGADKDVIVMSCQSIALPTESNDEVEIQFQNERRYVAGQYLVESVPFIVRDYVDQDTRDAVLRWRQLVRDRASGNIGLAKDYKKNALIVMSGPDGSSERICTLIGCWPQSVNFGQLDYAGSEQVMIELTLRFDDCDWGSGL